MAETGDPLSERELDVVALVAQGAANREIASRLSISPNTVKVHLRNVYTKLGVTSRAECTAVAIQRGLITLPGAGLTDPRAATTADPAPIAPPTVDEPLDDPGLAERPRPAWRLLALAMGLIAVTAVLLLLRSLRTPPLPELTPIPEVPIATNWFSAGVLPVARAGASVAAVGLDGFLIGGDGSDGRPADTVFVFSSGAGTWRSGAAKPTATSNASTAVLFGEIYVIGGRLVDGNLTAQVEVYSPANDAWRVVAALPQPTAGSIAVTDGSFIYVLGGETAAGLTDEVFVFDPGTTSWRPLPPLRSPRRNAAAGIIAGQLYIVAGEDESGALDRCETLSLADETWSTCAALLAPRAGAVAATLYNRLYAFGGNSAETTPYAEFFDPDSGTWQVVNFPADVLHSSWRDAGVATVERKIYLFGGRAGETLLDTNLVFVPFPYQTFIPSVPGP